MALVVWGARVNADQSTIVTAMGVTGASVYLGTLASRRTATIKPAVGVMVAGTILLTVASGAAGGKAHLAAQFAVLIATTAVLTSGYAGISAIGRYLTPTKGSIT